MWRPAIAFVVLVVLGMVGFVVRKEMNRAAAPVGRAVDEDESIVTISTGPEVAIEPHVASKGLTIVEFYAEF
jgi:hypothetical protein